MVGPATLWVITVKNEPASFIPLCQIDFFFLKAWQFAMLPESDA
jgi:hypothetical protein